MESDQDKYVYELALAFAKYIPVLAGTAGIKNTRFLTADIQSVDEDNRTCVVKGILDKEEVVYQDVNLSMERNDGLILVPAVDSTVLVGKMPDGELYVVHTSDIDKVICFIDGSNKFVFDTNGFVWNDGTLGGMAKTAVLATRLNNIENKVNSLITALQTVFPNPIVTPVTEPGNGAASALQLAVSTALTTWLSSSLTTTTQSQIEDTKIKH